MYRINKRLTESCSGVWMPLVLDVGCRQGVVLISRLAGSSLGPVAVGRNHWWGSLRAGMCVMYRHCQQPPELCCPFSSLGQAMAVPQLCPEWGTQRASLCCRHWAGSGCTQTQPGLGGKQNNQLWRCWEGKADKAVMALPLFSREGRAEFPMHTWRKCQSDLGATRWMLVLGIVGVGNCGVDVGFG